MNSKVVNLDSQLGPTGNSEVAQELAVATDVVSPTELGALSSHAWVSVKANSVYVTFDGTSPDTGTTVGCLLAAGYNAIWSRRTVKSAKFIQGTGAAKVRFEPFTG